MGITIRPYVVAVNHVEGCTQRKCGPSCERVKEGWEVDIVVRQPSGKVVRKRLKSPVPSKSGTSEWANRWMAEVLNPAPAPSTKASPTLAEFEPQFMNYSETNNKPSTVCAKRSVLDTHLLPYFGTMRLEAITPAEIEKYKAVRVRAGLSPKSVNNQLTVLRKLLNLAAEWGELGHAPRIRALRDEPKEIRFLSFDEEPRFLAAAPREWFPMVHTALKTGLRVGELLALKWEDVDLVVGRLVVRRTLWRGFEGSPKGGRSREVSLSDNAIAVLKGHRAATLLKSPYVFCSANGDRLTHSEVKNVVPSICKKAGLAKRLTTHDLRHSFASHLVMRGVTLKAVQELLGHTSIEMTLRYAHLSPDVKRDAVKLLDQAPSARAAGDILETGG